jgi:hypothetical protein
VGGRGTTQAYEENRPAQFRCHMAVLEVRASCAVPTRLHRRALCVVLDAPAVLVTSKGLSMTSLTKHPQPFLPGCVPPCALPGCCRRRLVSTCRSSLGPGVLRQVREVA